jgi:hypothetical protein
MKIHSIIDDPTRASRYLADKLTETECAEYEARFLQDPEAVAELEATARLKIGLRRLRESGELGELIAGSGATHPGRMFFVALAASVAAVIIGVTLWYPRFSATTAPVLASAATAFKDHSGHSLSVLATTPLFRTRTESYDAVIELPAKRGAIKLRVLPSTTAPQGARYEATLSRIRQDDSSERIVSIGDLQASAEDGFVDMYADSSLLAPGRYRLILTPAAAGSASGESDSFVIKVAAGVH